MKKVKVNRYGSFESTERKFSTLAIASFISSIIGCLGIAFAANFIPILLIVAIPLAIPYFALILIAGISLDPPYEEIALLWKNNYEKIYVYNFDHNYMDNLTYSKAADDCMAEIAIMGDRFEQEPWETIFRELNMEIAEIKRLEKEQIQKIDRPDYVKELKQSKEFYQQGMQEKESLLYKYEKDN